MADSDAPKPMSNVLNPDIRTNRPPNTVIPVKVSEIMDPSVLVSDFTTPKGNTFTVPFKNNLYHLRPVRVVDFHPPNLADFAAPHKPSEYEILSDHESDPEPDMDMTDPEVDWEWRFELLIEDATSSPGGTKRRRMKLLVAGTDADFLLRNIRATNLAEDKASLARLKEKLFLLWGDLQEWKEEGGAGGGDNPLKPSGRPFECLVKEYGVKVGGEWERIFAMFGTSIVSN